MNKFSFSENIIEEIEFEVFYNRHYITVDDNGNIINGWSDAFPAPKNAENSICINEQGGRQFRLFPNGEENPNLYDEDGIPLYKWDGIKVVKRADKEIEADKMALPKVPTYEERLAAMESAILTMAMTLMEE